MNGFLGHFLVGMSFLLSGAAAGNAGELTDTLKGQLLNEVGRYLSGECPYDGGCINRVGALVNWLQSHHREQADEFEVLFFQRSDKKRFEVSASPDVKRAWAYHVALWHRPSDVVLDLFYDRQEMPRKEEYLRRMFRNRGPEASYELRAYAIPLKRYAAMPTQNYSDVPGGVVYNHCAFLLAFESHESDFLWEAVPLDTISN